MACIDLQPNASVQAKDRDDIYNIGGFSDQVFTLLAAISRGEADQGFWVDCIKGTTLRPLETAAVD